MRTAARPRVHFGEHSTQRPAIERFVDHDQFAVTFGTFSGAEARAADLLVPLTVAQIADVRVAANGRAVVPDADVVALCDDKLAFNERLIALGFGEHVPALLGDSPDCYPYIRKARFGDFGAGCVMVRGPGDDRPVADSFCQRAVEGQEEEVLHLLRVHGAIRFARAYRYDMGTPLAVRGAAERPRSTVPADVATAIAPCEAILDAIGFEGTCCFNYKLEGGRVMLLELNPRFGGSLVGEVSAYLDAHLSAFA